MPTFVKQTTRPPLRRSTIRTTLLEYGGAGGGIPTNAILDRDGNPILDRDGNYVTTR